MALTVAVSGLTACEPVAEGGFSLLTYNVAGLPQEISPVTPGTNIPLISPKLEPYDVVVTQEDFDWWIPELDVLDFAEYHTRLRAQTTHPWATGQHPGPAAVGIDGSDPERPMPLVGDGNGILSRFPFDGADRVPWEHCFGSADTSDGGAADCLAMKGFARARLTLADGVEVDLYTVHAEAGRTAADTRMIAEDFDLLAGYIATHSAGRAVIVAGDTNLHTRPGHVMEPVHAPIWTAFLADTGLVDVCVAVECQDPGGIDKVAFRNGGGVTLAAHERRLETDVFVDSEGRALSDHPPVSVEFTWTLWA
ncbi:MAG: hypothetical protein GX643_02945 [Acidimicrobiales bacterium]|nr:hypothetical protein [Acidimicrobiales bacterium]